MNVKFITGPMSEHKKKEAQAYIQKRALEIYTKQKQTKPGA